METIKQNIGRGGRRPGAGRPSLEPGQEKERKVTKSITLSAEDWDFLSSLVGGGSLSVAVAGAVELARDPRSRPAGWRPVGPGA